MELKARFACRMNLTRRVSDMRADLLRPAASDKLFAILAPGRRTAAFNLGPSSFIAHCEGKWEECYQRKGMMTSAEDSLTHRLERGRRNASDTQ